MVVVVAVLVLAACAVSADITASIPVYNGKPGAKIGDTCMNPKDGAVMVWVPAGEFLTGSDCGYLDEKPSHKVYLDGYWIYKYEVTVGQYRKFCQETGRSMPITPFFGWKDRYPIVNVYWREATDYAKWAGMRLPTEAEWEKAARGPDGRTYPWGSRWDPSSCNNCLSGQMHPQPVGSYPKGASPYGCLDMAGNVWEWCDDWFSKDYYKTSPYKNPKGSVSGTYHVLKGGGWICGSDLTRSSFRFSYHDEYSSGISYSIGFRLVR